MAKGSSGINLSMGQVKQLQSDLTKAKTAASKAEKKYLTAAGAVTAFDWNNGRSGILEKYEKAIKERDDAKKIYDQAVEKRDSLQTKLDKYAEKQRKRRADEPFF